MIINNAIAQNLHLIELFRYTDTRGTFTRVLDRSSLANLIADPKFPEIDYSYLSTNHKRYTLRGFHYQVSPYGQWKYMTCLRGACQLSVIRPDCAGESYSFMLSSTQPITVIVGPEYATAFLTLEDSTDIFYNVSGLYSEPNGKVIRWDDERWSVGWLHEPCVISEKDSFKHGR
jgi:dTDP-4-dehydrorhamnose 3,5-epimerase